MGGEREFSHEVYSPRSHQTLSKSENVKKCLQQVRIWATRQGFKVSVQFEEAVFETLDSGGAKRQKGSEPCPSAFVCEREAAGGIAWLCRSENKVTTSSPLSRQSIQVPRLCNVHRRGRIQPGILLNSQHHRNEHESLTDSNSSCKIPKKRNFISYQPRKIHTHR